MSAAIASGCGGRPGARRDGSPTQLGQAPDGRVEEAMAPAGQLDGSLEEREQIGIHGE
jgi:hypothetical protein